MPIEYWPRIKAAIHEDPFQLPNQQRQSTEGKTWCILFLLFHQKFTPDSMNWVT